MVPTSCTPSVERIVTQEVAKEVAVPVETVRETVREMPVERVVVNGQTLVENGVYTDRQPGRLI